jgi:integrase
MGRPGLSLGTAGAVRTYKTADGYRAMTRYRDWDGKVRQIERRARTKGAATQALALAIRDRSSNGSGADITPETKLGVLAEVWFDQISQGGLSPSTLRAYRDRLDRQILPAMAEVRVRELTTGLVDRHLAAVKAKHGAALAKTTKSVLSNVCRLACRHDALEHNPCRDVARISTKPNKPPTALSVEQVRKLHLWLAEDTRSVSRDLPDLILFLAATGLRIGEALAVQWVDVDLEARTVEVRGTVLRVRPGGLMIKPSPKSAAGQRILELPSWAVDMLERRQSVSRETEAPQPSQLFAAPVAGGLRDPSNTLKMMRQAFKAAGFEGVTSHQFRKTVATLMDEAGLSARAAADQLGHSNTSLTANFYMGRKKRATGAAAVLEDLFS